MATPNLTREQAEQRAALLEVESYHIELDLTDGKGRPGEGTFLSTTTVRFHSREVGASTWIDLVAADVESAVLNGVKLDVSEYREENGIALLDLAEVNELVVRANCQYTNFGKGMHRFVEPAGSSTAGDVYVYTKFEPAEAKRVFTCFDQPDLKATYQVTAIMPASWKAISNTAIADSVKLADGSVQHTFEPTAKLSTYLVALVAGPYAEWRDEYVDDYGTIPLGFYCRASLAEYLDHEKFFTQTKQGLGFFHRTFNSRYPFGKYDQIFVPEFSAGAMENVGCVTIIDRYLFRGKIPRYLHEAICKTILHEMAHMWFGDLVTMRWWDDLWLNESFADWAAYSAQAEATEYKEAWATFAGARKAWAYQQDQQPTTHPIIADIPNVEAVKSNFDGITYAKGASALKQLVTYVGLDNFLGGLRLYFDRHAWGNATFTDLLAALEETSGRDLSNWSQQWLHTTGLNILRPEYTIDSEGKITNFTVIQEGATPGAGELRPHRLAIGIYDDSADGKLIRIHRIETDVTGERTEVPGLIGLPSGKLVLVNDDDLTYCNLRLDEASLKTVIDRIADIESPLVRAQCWIAAWHMTRETEMKARDFVRLVINGVHAEAGGRTAREVLARAQVALSSYADPTWAPTGWQQFTDRVLTLIHDDEPGSDQQLALVNILVGSVLEEKALTELRGWLDGSAPLAGLDIDIEMRWRLLRALVAHGVLDKVDIEAELKRDATAEGERQAEWATALIPTLEAKETAWQRTMHEHDLPTSIIEEAGQGFHHPGQKELLVTFTERYFAEVAEMWQQRPSDKARVMADLMFPSWSISQETVAAADKWLEDEHPAALSRIIKERRAGVVRSLKARAFDQA